jgi:hypothetical protein
MITLFVILAGITLVTVFLLGGDSLDDDDDWGY